MNLSRNQAWSPASGPWPPPYAQPYTPSMGPRAANRGDATPWASDPDTAWRGMERAPSLARLVDKGK